VLPFAAFVQCIGLVNFSINADIVISEHKHSELNEQVT